MSGFWFRLDADWSRQAWIRSCPRLVRGAWPELVAHIRREGGRGASIRYSSAEDLAYELRYEADEVWIVVALVEAAVAGGQIEVGGGTLRLIRKDLLQTPDAQRKQEARGRTCPDLEETASELPECPDVSGQTSDEGPMSGHVRTTSESTPNVRTCPETPVARDKRTREQGNKRTTPLPLPPGGAPPPDAPARVRGAPRFGPTDLFDLLPETHQTVAIRDALDQFEAYRRARRFGRWVQASLDKQAQAIAEHPPEATVWAISRAIANGWQGFFPERWKAPSNSPMSWAEAVA